MHSHSRRLNLAFALVLVIALALSGMVLLAPSARADHETLPWRSYGFVSANLGFVREDPTVFADQQGHVYVFYMTQNLSSGLWNLNVSKFATRGPLDRPLLLVDDQVNTATNVVRPGFPAVAMDASGNLYVAYVENRGTTDNIYVSKSTTGGVAWSPEVDVSANAGTNALAAIAASPSGTVYVAWALRWGAFQNISFASSTDAGATFSTPVNVTTPGGSGTSEVSMSVDSGGRIYVAYDYFNRATRYWSANLSRSDDGTTWVTSTLSNPNGDVFSPSVLADAWGDVHAVWYDPTGGTGGIFYSRSQDRGASWSAPVRLSGNVTVLNTRTSIAESGGTLMAGWTGSTPSPTYGLSYAISADRGNSWYPAEFYPTGSLVDTHQITADENGTFYGVEAESYGNTSGVALDFWLGPPTTPTITGVSAAANGLRVNWAQSPEPNVNGYRVYRSSDGMTFTLIAALPASASAYVDPGLANGTYWYEVQAVNDEAILSHVSTPALGTVGLTTQQRIDQLNAQLASLRSQLATLQGNTSALESEISQLQNQLNALQGQQATQTMAYATLAFEVIVVALLVVILLTQLRRPKRPQVLMAPRAPTETRHPEDDL